MDSLAYMLASGGDDNSLKLWFWLIVGVIFLIKKAIELLKPDEKDEETSVPDTENRSRSRRRRLHNPRKQPGRRRKMCWNAT